MTTKSQGPFVHLLCVMGYDAVTGLAVYFLVQMREQPVMKQGDSRG